MMIFDKMIYRKEDLFNRIIESIKNSRGDIYTYLNFHGFNEFYVNENYRKLMLSDINFYSSDMGMFFLLRTIFGVKAEKFNGSDFNCEIVNYIYSNKKKIFFIGGNFSQLDLGKIKGVLGGYQNGFFSVEENYKILETIIHSKSDIVLIGMGIPKQEYFADFLIRNGLQIPVICVGNFLEFYLETIKRAPKFLRNSGLEWCFRLFIEPRRLWRRYIIGIPKFIISILYLRISLFFRASAQHQDH
ncbi:MAG: WecB/TagA/CpsF family glycosyltransferase [Ignavibacteria bacterium]